MATRSKPGRTTRGEDAVTADAAPVARRAEPAACSRGTVVKAIGGCARACASDDIRAALHALTRAARRVTRSHRRLAALDASVATCLDAVPAAGADRWPLAEAAAWGLFRLARVSRRADSAGRHLERLVAEARMACGLLAERDTRAARFVLVVARLFHEIEACRDLEHSAAKAVAEEIARLVTAAGAVVLSGSAAVVERVARWTHFREAAATLGGEAWPADVEARWLAAATHALRLLGDGGRCVATDGASGRDLGIASALASAAGGRIGRTARRVVRGGSRRAGLLRLDMHDAEAATAVIRSGWGPEAVRILVEYRDTAPLVEIAVGERMLVAGAWEWGVTADGRPLDAEAAWTVSCWESDRKAAFLELAAPLAGGKRLERQVVLLRRQKIVLLADAVVDAAAAAAGPALGFRAAVRLADALDAEPAAETREVLVYDGGMRLMALPLALPEWRTAGQGGLTVADGSLVLEQAGHGRLFAPLWIDCDPRRIGRPLTWRQLTVADTRRNLPPHQAAGFRVQAGLEQWLLYRTLDAARNRTLLGCNVSSGFLLGRVKRSGEVARTVEIE